MMKIYMSASFYAGRPQKKAAKIPNPQMLSACYVWVRLAVTIKAKFHYASWFGACSEPASVMEFGFYRVWQ